MSGGTRSLATRTLGDRIFGRIAAGHEADQVLLTTRLLAWFIVPFLAAGAAILLVWPTETERLFAWGIKPRMTAMALGATYTGGIVFFVRVIRARSWSSVSLGFFPVTGFAATLGVATLLHWGNFNHDHVAFWTWAALYFTTPALVLLAWLRNTRVTSTSAAGSPMIQPRLRVLLGALALAFAAVSLALFLFPATTAEAWAWTLSPLTARVMAAAFLLPALLKLAIALDGRWSAARIPLEAEIVALALVLLSAARARSDFGANDAATAGFVIGLLGLLALGVGLYARAVSLPQDRAIS